MIRFSLSNEIRWTRAFDQQDGNHGRRLLLQAKFTTDQPFLKWLKRFKLIGLHRLLPVENLVHLKLGFKNIGHEAIPNVRNVQWAIIYPQGSVQFRQWKLNIPSLEVGQERWTEPPWLFMPEVPGQHTMVILRPFSELKSVSPPVIAKFEPSNDESEIASLKYAAPYGLIGREFALTDDMWKASFYVLGRGEFITINIILGTVVLAFISVVLTLFPLLGRLFD